MKTGKRAKGILNTALALILTMSLAAGVAVWDEPAYAASEFATGSPFSNTGYSSYTHAARFSDNLIVNGVDISDWQSKNCRFGDAKAAGVDFSIMRVTWTSYGKSDLTLHNDDNFQSQYVNAKANGVMTGVYVFSQAKNASEGAREAEFAIKRLRALGIGPKDLNLPVYMDYEFFNKGGSRLSGLSEEDAVAAAKAFCKTVRSYGYDAGIYANSYFFSNYLNNGRDLPENTDFWIAQYSSSINSECSYTKWQYSSSAKVDTDSGSADRVDINYWYIDKETEESAINISGNTSADYTGDPVLPEFGIHYKGKHLVKGVDYIVGGIRNIDIGSESYAYIKGIGDYEGYALVPVNIENDIYEKINLPAKVITGTNLEDTGYLVYSDTGRTTIGIIPEGTTVGELLSDIDISSEDYYTGVIDSQGNRLAEREKVSFSNMIGVFSCEDDTLIGTVDIETETEKGINHLRHK